MFICTKTQAFEYLDMFYFLDDCPSPDLLGSGLCASEQALWNFPALHHLFLEPGHLLLAEWRVDQGDICEDNKIRQ